MLNYVFLILAIVAEAAGTTLLKMSEQFTKLVPSIASLVCYVASLYLLSLCLRTIPIGIAYATWSALGIALITVSGIFFFKQMPDLGGHRGARPDCFRRRRAESILEDGYPLAVKPENVPVVV